MKYNNILRSVFLFLLVGVFSLNFVFAFGASADYWEDSPLQLEPGQSKDIEIRLQNMAGKDKSIVLRASLQGAEDFGTLVDEDLDYVVPFGEDNVKVNVLVEVPEDAIVGETYELVVSFDQLASPDDSFLQLAGAVRKRIPVEIIGEQESDSSGAGAVFVVVLVLIAVAIAVTVYVRKRRRNSFEVKK